MSPQPNQLPMLMNQNLVMFNQYPKPASSKDSPSFDITLILPFFTNKWLKGTVGDSPERSYRYHFFQIRPLEEVGG